jgi:hypothetical protein
LSSFSFFAFSSRSFFSSSSSGNQRSMTLSAPCL